MDTRSLLSCCMAASLIACQTSQTSAKAQASPPPAAPASTAAAPTQEKPIELSLRVEALTTKGPPRFIESDEVLRSGDRLALHVDVSEPAYVYVGHRAANGTRSIIFPRSGSELFGPGVDHRIPAAGQWFKLDRDSGQEDIFLYASRKPLSSEETQKLLETDSARWKRAAPRSKQVAKAKASPKRAPAAPTAPASASEQVPADLEPANSRGMELDTPEDVERSKDLTKAHFLIRHRK